MTQHPQKHLNFPNQYQIISNKVLSGVKRRYHNGRSEIFRFYNNSVMESLGKFMQPDNYKLTLL